MTLVVNDVTNLYWLIYLIFGYDKYLFLRIIMRKGFVVRDRSLSSFPSRQMSSQ